MTAGPRGEDPRSWPTESPATIRRFFAGRGKRVISFAGYGELGYQQPDRVREVALAVLADQSPDGVLVHTGTLQRAGGLDGIAEIHVVAKEFGFETAGVHPSVAREFAETHRVSPACDHAFFVRDETWGGLLPGGAVPSPTLRLHLEISDEAVFVGGGKHAADELRAFLAHGTPVRYFPAEMNHAMARDWCARAHVVVPDFRGAAHSVPSAVKATITALDAVMVAFTASL